MLPFQGFILISLLTSLCLAKPQVGDYSAYEYDENDTPAKPPVGDYR